MEIKSVINPDDDISKLKNYALNELIPLELREVHIDAAIREIVCKYDTELLNAKLPLEMKELKKEDYLKN